MAPPHKRFGEGTVRSLTARGEGVVDTPNGPVRVPHAVPGDRVRVGDLHRSGQVWRGRLVSVLAPGPQRREPPCAVHARCGGCALMTLDLAAQREHKRVLVASAVGRATGQPEGHPPVEWVDVPAAEELGYRRRARLSFRQTAQGVVVGHRAPRSRHVVDAEACVVLAPPLVRCLGEMHRVLAPHLLGSGEVLLHPGAGGGVVLVVETAEPQPPAAYDAAAELARREGVAGVALRVGGGALAAWGDPRQHAEGHDGLPLVGPPGGFAQANEAVNRSLVAWVRELAEPDGQRVLELFAGHGNLTVALAPGARSLTALERDPASAQALEDNVRRRGLDVRVVCGDAAHALPAGAVDVAVLDPPREGAAEALPALIARAPRRIVYVSCEPATLGRDLARLVACGYAPDRALMFDMFPHTAHVEAVVRLERRSTERATQEALC
jgi:23S rRNA (uracil1939-C5)-methyltransferase